MKKTFTAALALALATSAFAQNEILRIELNDGTTQDVEVAAIKQITFADSEENPQTPAEKIAGEYSGISDVAVGAMWNYQSETISVKIEANADGTINFTWPEYMLKETQMGDLTLGTVTIPNIPYEEAKKAFYLDYGKLGLKQHFSNGSSMNGEYVLNDPSTITIEMTDDGIKVTNPFKLGNMPFPLTATFNGK